MSLKSLAVSIRVLVFVLVLGASSTAYADAIAFTSYSFNNITFTSSSGTAVFTATALNTRALVQNSLGALQDNVSTSFPIAQANSSIPFASASGVAVTPNYSVGASATADPRGAVTSGSLGVGELTGTLVVTGVDGAVNVTLSALESLLQHVETDQFGVAAESDILFNVFLNGTPVFSFQVERTVFAGGPNLLTHIEGSGQISRMFSVQGGATNTILIRASAGSIAVSDVPEPATVLLLVSGLGFMTGVVKKKRKSANQ